MKRPAKPVTIRAVHPNQGLEVAYRQRLDALIEEMQASLVYWLKARYRANPPAMAQDESAAMAMRRAMGELSRRWQSRFDRAAPDLASYFATAVGQRTDAALKAALKKAGFTVEFKLTREANDALQATIGENVGLIKSIASQHLSDVEGMVMRSVAAGRDLGTLTKDLQARYGVTKRRAALISRDQNNRATAIITRVRQEGLGITEAVWLHSAGGKHPRPSHFAFNGQRYNIAEGALIDGERIYPGSLIGCRCVSKSVIPGLGR